jgi:3'(2'), 5'-bisphosphate nucleotidase
MMLTTSPQLQAALDAVRQGSRIARAVQHELDRVRQITKDDKSPVTVADFAVQAIVAMTLHDRLGATLIVGEEHTDALRTQAQSHVLDAVVHAVQRETGRSISQGDVLNAIDACNHDGSAETYWTLDPVDGTKGFLRGQQYAIALALIESGQVTLGVMGCPNLPLDHAADLEQADAHGCMYAAAHGQGAWEYELGNAAAAPQRIHAQPPRENQPLRVCESVESSHSKQDDTARIIAELASHSGAPARLDSQCKYAVVARGQADVYLRLPTGKSYVEKIWDHAAGMIIACQAGAVVSDVTGSPLDFGHGRRLERNRGIVCAAGPLLHQRVIGAIERLGIGAAV